jgi:hypothetical protein
MSEPMADGDEIDTGAQEVNGCTNRYAVVDLETKRKTLERAGPISENTDRALASWRADTSVLKWLEAL